MVRLREFREALPVRERGYREYGAYARRKSWGARHCRWPRQLFYTDDHYNSFKRVGDPCLMTHVQSAESGVYLAPDHTHARRRGGCGLAWPSNLGRVGNKREFPAACAKAPVPQVVRRELGCAADCLKHLAVDLVADLRNCEPFAEAAPRLRDGAGGFQDAAGFWEARQHLRPGGRSRRA
jgi:hypothetical protein